MRKSIVVVNGHPGVGKDTLCDGCDIPHMKISSIDPVKNAATILGWSGVKTPSNRDHLSKLKELSSSWWNGPLEYEMEKINWFMQGDQESQIIFVMIREPDEIRAFIEAVNHDWHITPYTILVGKGFFNKNEVCEVIINTSDTNVEDYRYNYYFTNTGTIEESCNRFAAICKPLLESVWYSIDI